MTATPAPGTEPHRPNADGPLATTAPGKTAITLTRPQKILVGFVAAGAIAIAAIGFTGSYTAVTQLAYSKGFGGFSRIFTLGVDIGIGVFLALDLLLTWLRMPFPLLRYGAWMLTAATIAFNAVVSWPDPVGVSMHAVIPILFVVAVEAARHAIGRIADITADKHMEGPNPSRWFLNPFGTFLLWRRQRLWGIRTWDTMLKLEQGRRIYRANLRKDHGRGWRRKATAEELLVLSLAKNGMSIQDAIDLPKKEAKKLAEAEAARKAEADAKADTEAEAKHQAELRTAQAEAKRRTEIAEAEAAEAEAKSRAEAATEAARLEVEAKQHQQTEAARLLVAETEAKLADIARTQQDAEAEADLNRQRRTAEEARLQAEAARHAREKADAQAQQRRQDEARQRAQRITAQATTTSSTSASASVPAVRTSTTSGAASTSVSAITGPRAKKQAEVEAVLAHMVEADDPEAVSLKWIQEHFDLKQTTAYDRLKTAQDLYEKARSKSA